MGGCTKKEQASVRTPSVISQLPADLKLMQGLWESRKSDAVCAAQIEGFTIRMTYKDPDHEIHYKRNACIKELDSVNRQLQVHGDKKPWSYIIRRESSCISLELRFYDENRRQWIHSSLEQPVESVQLAGI